MDTHQYRFERENSSFSSTLLDVIYRSIDERQDIDSVNVERTSGNQVNVARRKSGTGFENSRHEAMYVFPTSNKPKPIRTCIREDNENECNMHVNEKLESKFVKTKSKAMKIYGYLKQGKHPISPGGRLKSFLASFFSNEKDKKSTKSKMSCTGSLDEVIIPPKSKSVSSFSRTCVNKATSTSSSFRKSVTFIIDECAKPLGHMNNRKNDDDDVDDDDMSCSSSDLFELDNLSAIGIDSCMQELPLYETTNVDVNRAIANGLLV